MVNNFTHRKQAAFVGLFRGTGLLLALSASPAFCTSQAKTGFSGRIVLTLTDAASFPLGEGQKLETRPIRRFSCGDDAATRCCA